jgi:Dockerin type I domain
MEETGDWTWKTPKIHRGIHETHGWHHLSKNDSPRRQVRPRGTGFQRMVNATGTATATVDIGVFEWQPYVCSIAAVWGTQTASLKAAADGLRLLPVGRKTDLPWLNINKLTIILSQAEPLTPADVTVSNASGASYGPVTLSGSGTSYTITLAQAITKADRVTIKINLAGMVTPTYELDVLPGDFNHDGVVNSQDMVLIRNEIQETGDPLMIGWADVDGNGVVNVNDYIAARKKLGSRLP